MGKCCAGTGIECAGRLRKPYGILLLLLFSSLGFGLHRENYSFECWAACFWQQTGPFKSRKAKPINMEVVLFFSFPVFLSQLGDWGYPWLLCDKSTAQCWEQQLEGKDHCLYPLKGWAVHQVPKRGGGRQTLAPKQCQPASSWGEDTMPAPQQAKKILEKKQTFVWHSLEFTPAMYWWARLLSSVTTQPQITQAQGLQGQLCHCLPALGLSPCGTESLTLNSSMQPKKGGSSHSVFLESGTHNCAKILNSYRTSGLYSVRSWLFSWGRLSAEVRPCAPGSGRWRSPRAGTEPQQVLAPCRRLWQMSAGVTDTSVLLLSLAQCLEKERKADVMPLWKRN